jgi:microcystin-dependent protein
MANYEATRYDFDGAFLTGIEGVNTGIVVPWGSASIPSGFLLCDGQSVSTTTYAALFAVIGYTYGGSGANFNVPDLKDRTVVGVSSANSKALAQSIGANTVTPTGNIAGSTGSTTLTSAQIPAHAHQFSTTNLCAQRIFYRPSMSAMSALSGGESPGDIRGNQCMSLTQTGSGQSHDHTLSANFSGSANSVLQPGLVLNYIIKT